MRHLTRIADLSIDEIDALTDTARRVEAGELVRMEGLVAGLLFLGPSLRTRVGFATAVARMGGSSIDVYEPRWSPDMSAAESVEDTVRTMSGMVDVLVVRTSVHDTTQLARVASCPLINGGDVVEHPAQALIDYWAILEERGEVSDLHIALVGDLGMRAATSLLRLLGQRLPRRVTLIAPPGRDPIEGAIGPELMERAHVGDMDDAVSADVVYVVGLPAGRGESVLGDRERADYAITPDRMSTLRHDAVVLSPMPVIDEISIEARHDPRVRLWAPSDRSVSMRQAVLATIIRPGRA